MARKLAVAVLVAVVAGGVPVAVAPPTDAAEAPPWAECWDGVRADGGDPRAGRIHRLYSAYFLRSPDHSGMTYWVDLSRREVSIHQISAAFAGSAEFVATYGALTDADFVDLVYRNVLDRPADPRGRAHWLDVLDRRALGRGGVMLSFADSPEYVARTDTTAPTARCPLPAPTAAGFRTQLSHAARLLPGMDRLGGVGLAGARVHYDTPTAFAATFTRDSFRRPVDLRCRPLWVCVSGELGVAQAHLAVLEDELFDQLHGATYGSTGMPTDLFGDIVGPTRRVSHWIYDDGAEPRWRMLVEIVDPDTIHASIWAVVPGQRRTFEWGM
jgi:hypothetical protein